MLFATYAERIRSQIERVAALGPRARTRWASAKADLGQPVTVELKVARNRLVLGEPRQSSDEDGAVREWHSQRELTVLCTVYSTAPPVAATDRGGAYLTSAVEVLERICTRLNSDRTATALVPGECAFQGEGDIMSVDIVRDGRAVDTASAELLFTYAGVDTEGAEGEGEITSLDATSALLDVDGTETPAGWDEHVISKPPAESDPA